MKFEKWLKLFIEEKEIDLEETFTIGNNIFDYEYVVECIKAANPEEQANIKNMLVKIDFKNGNVRDFLRYLTNALI